ncbi:tRNA lysidine(34) synthetase TilS [Labrys monachus]|uniref:tRNA(Ile)-lysidine synthase n=1 Tax=Labrys monachus TaxID=217067 RepID=A0ABU0F895_9HYPH|nr:tRNA lysidine(34) synthetase TilS [Labrys monachus]MDQ0390837.1 tRNA(Ile)-lysidine synthase [Labrys monachus]
MYRDAAASPLSEDELPALFASFGGCRHILLAVSGGRDSTAMMLLAALRRRQAGGPDISVATIDHGLRDESARECALVLERAASLGLRGLMRRWTGEKPATRLQEKAREARYRLLSEAAADIGADAIATAHTLDDQAETVLMRLARGSSLDGLAAMRAATRRGALLHLRPLLGTPRARLTATLRQAGMPWIDDPSNVDPRFERTRIRDLLAALGPLGLQAERLALLARRAARGADALDHVAQATLAAAMRRDEEGVVLDPGLLAGVPAEIRLRVLEKAIAAVRTGDRPSYRLRLERLESLQAEAEAAIAAGRGGWRRSLGGALVSLDRDGRLLVRPEGERHRGRGPAMPQV